MSFHLTLHPPSPSPPPPPPPSPPSPPPPAAPPWSRRGSFNTGTFGCLVSSRSPSLARRVHACRCSAWPALHLRPCRGSASQQALEELASISPASRMARHHLVAFSWGARGSALRSEAPTTSSASTGDWGVCPAQRPSHGSPSHPGRPSPVPKGQPATPASVSIPPSL